MCSCEEQTLPSPPPKKKKNQPNKPPAPLKQFYSKDNLSKNLGGINLFSAYPMAIHAGYKILDYFLLG